MAYALPIQWSDNGHWYEAVSGDLTWDQANAAAQSMTHDGATGQLATLTSAEENAFVWDNFGVQGYWLGGSQPGGGDWAWETAENWLYTNWSGSEPASAFNQYLQLGSGGVWNNWDSIDLLRGFANMPKETAARWARSKPLSRIAS